MDAQMQGGGGCQGAGGHRGAVVVSRQDGFSVPGSQVDESIDDRMSRVAAQIQQEEEQLLHQVSEANSEVALADLWSQTYACMERIDQCSAARCR